MLLVFAVWCVWGDPEDLAMEFSVDGDKLPYWEQKVNRRFYVTTNEVTTPFGVVYSNVYARVAAVTNPASGFFLAANQHDSDNDGAPDAVENSLGLNPLDPDMDGDGIPDGRELTLGMSPTLLDSDGDGLMDAEEMAWGVASTNGAALWLDTTNAADWSILFTNADDAVIHLALPFEFRLFNVVATNVSVDANGLVAVSAHTNALAGSHRSNDEVSWAPVVCDPAATIAAFWDDIRVRPDMGSVVSFATVGAEGDRTAVIEFSHVGFYYGSTNDYVSFQVQLPEAETNMAYVVFSEASGLGTGESATLGARTSRGESVQFSCNEADTTFPGLVLSYHFGLGTDPAKADPDGDGLSDPDELAAGTDPHGEDTDGDGIVDGAEVAAGTGPLDPDSDNDNLPDGWEVDNGLDPLDPDDGLSDADDDGLPFWHEVLELYTDPDCWDSDGDGLSDYVEWNGLTNALNPDTDGDGLLDGQEATLGTNPRDADTDGDGCPDGWEVRYGFDPLDNTSPVSNADPDGDGLTNLEEARNDTNPISTDSDLDGLSDAHEVGYVSQGIAQVFDISSATNLLNGLSDMDDGYFSLSLPFPIVIHSRTVCSNIAVSLNGFVNLSTEDPADSSSSPDAENPLVVEAFHDDLTAYPTELGSTLRTAEMITNGVRHFVVEYRNFGFYGADVILTNAVSFQIDFAEDATNMVRVSFFRADGGTDPLTLRALGADATLGAETERCTLVFSHGAPVAHPGLAVEYHLGVGTSPVEADMDDDGLLDGDEVNLGLDPFIYDMDGDGLPDGWEVVNGLDPLNSADGTADSDNDGLSNADEFLNGTNPNAPDTDGDGVADSVEVGQGSDPSNAADGGENPGVDALLPLPFHVYGDYAAWEMTIAATQGDTRTFRLSTLIPDQSITRSILLRKGATYGISLRWRGSGEYRDPLWYCWEAQIGRPLAPASCCFPDDVPTRLPGNEILVGDGWICENADGLLTSHVHMNANDGGNVAAGKTATLHVLKVEPEFAESDSSGNWIPLATNHVVLDDEPLRLRLNIFPAISQKSYFLQAFPESVLSLSSSGTHPLPVNISDALIDAVFVSFLDRSELRMSFDRTNVIQRGLLPSANEDSIDEIAAFDVASDPPDPSGTSTLADSVAFLSSSCAFRGFATHSGTLTETPPQSPLSISFIQSGGIELVEACFDGTRSSKRQIMNQADTFYYSGHGIHATGVITGGGVACSPAQVANYWSRDLNCAILACCSVLDINDYRKEHPLNSGFSPGLSWVSLGPRFLLGYNSYAPGDVNGAPARIAARWQSMHSTEGEIMSWMRSNANDRAWNACAIDVVERKYYYFKKNKFSSLKVIERKDW